MKQRISSLMAAAALTCLACGGSAAKAAADPRFPPLPEGCAVSVFPEAPSTPTENIGPVSATCDDFVSDEDCLRTLKDEACKLGGDVVWGVPAASQPVSGTTKKRFQGRAAHTAPAAR